MNRSALLALVPVLVAAVVFANTVPGDFVFDDVVLIEKGEALRGFDLRRVFLSNYWGHDYADRNWRPLTLLTHALNARLGAGPASFHVVNLLLNAAAALLAYLVLLALIRDPILATLGASIFAALPIHTEAVANIVGRAEVLAGMAILGAWLLSLRDGAAEGAGRAAAAGAITFLGLCSKENAVVIPILLVASAWVLGRRIPWFTAAGSAAGVIVYVAVRAVVLGGKENVITLVDNPLAFTDPATRALNAIRLLGLYLVKTAAPIHLSADYSLDQIAVLPLASPLLWLEAGAVLLVLAGTIWLSRRRAPLLTLAAVFFLVTIAPVSNVLLPLGTIFGERLAYTPSFAWPLLLCGLARTAPLARRRLLCHGLLALLIVLYGARSWSRNRDWASATAMDIRMARDAPSSTRSHLKAAEGHVALAREAKAPAERDALLAKALEHLRRSLEIHPEHGKAIAKEGEVLLLQGKPAEAAERLTRAGEVLARQKPPLSEPLILRFRGECWLRLRRFPQALEDIDRYVEIRKKRAQPPDGVTRNFRGLALAGVGRLEEALAEFHGGLELRPDLPELWSNRGYCRFLLGDHAGAVADYEAGLEVCRKSGILFEPEGESAHAFLARIAQVHLEDAKARRAGGDEAGAREAEARAARRAAEADEIRKRAGSGSLPERRGPR